MEFRLGNQQRHSITAVLLSAVVIIFGLVLIDVVSGPEPDPLGTRTAAIDTSTTSPEPGPSKPGDDLTAGVARSNARFTLNPDVTVVEAESSTTSATSATSTVVRRSTAAPGEVTSASSAPTTTTSLATTTTTAEVPESSTTSTTSSPTTPTTVATTAKPKGKPSTTVVDDETTTTKKCRGNRPGCRRP